MATLRINNPTGRMDLVSLVSAPNVSQHDTLVLAPGEYTATSGSVWMQNLTLVGGSRNPRDVVITICLEPRVGVTLRNLTLQARPYNAAMFLEAEDASVLLENVVVIEEPTASYSAVAVRSGSLTARSSTFRQGSGIQEVDVQEQGRASFFSCALDHVLVTGSAVELHDCAAKIVQAKQRGTIRSTGVLWLDPTEGYSPIQLEGQSFCTIDLLRAGFPAEAVLTDSMLRVGHVQMNGGFSVFHRGNSRIEAPPQPGVDPGPRCPGRGNCSRVRHLGRARRDNR